MPVRVSDVSSSFLPAAPVQVRSQNEIFWRVVAGRGDLESLVGNGGDISSAGELSGGCLGLAGLEDIQDFRCLPEEKQFDLYQQ